MREQILFRMPPPTTGDAFLCAVAAMQEYERYLIMSKPIGHQADFYVIGDSELLDLIPMTKGQIEYKINEWPKGPVDLDFQFDIARAFSIAGAWNMHCTNAFSLQLGVEPPSTFPRLKTPPKEFAPDTDVLIHRRSFTDCELKELTNVVNDMKLKHVVIEDLPHTIGPSAMCKVIVSQTCFSTLVSATLGRKVVELYPDHWAHTGWMAKFGRAPYYLIKQTLEPKRRLELLLRAVRLACHEYRPAS